MNIATSLDGIGLLYSLFITVMICGVCVCVLNVLNADLLDLFQFMYILRMDIGNLMFVFCRGFPCLAIYIDLNNGVHEALIDDCTGFKM